MAPTHGHPDPLSAANEERRDDAAHWAQTSTLRVSKVPTGALNLNVDGRLAVGPLQGFGQLWQKTYRLHLSGVAMTPMEVMQIWKANFARFQPPHNHFYPVEGTIEPGQVILINATLTGMPLPTGVVVLYADDESFSLMTPQGHPESGWVTFSVYTVDTGLICEVQSLARANDPLYEIGFRLLGSGVQEQIWVYVLQALATHLQVDGQVTLDKVCVDPHVQWSAVKNIWQNAALRSILYLLGAPLRWLRFHYSQRQG